MFSISTSVCAEAIFISQLGQLSPAHSTACVKLSLFSPEKKDRSLQTDSTFTGNANVEGKELGLSIQPIKLADIRTTGIL